jgi:hypothetical protein
VDEAKIWFKEVHNRAVEVMSGRGVMGRREKKKASPAGNACRILSRTAASSVIKPVLDQSAGCTRTRSQAALNATLFSRSEL